MKTLYVQEPTTPFVPSEHQAQQGEHLQIPEPLKSSKTAGKRIVSKSEYVLRRAFQGGLAFSCTCAVGVALLSGLAAIIALIVGTCTVVYAIYHHHLQEEWSDVLNCLARVLVFGGVSGLSWWLALVAVKKSKENIVVPLTRANTGDIPAPDSLVRASSEPLQTQKDVLLRAAAQGQERHEEHLVRASIWQE